MKFKAHTAAFLGLLLAPAVEARPVLSVTFDQPSAVIAPGDSVPVNITARLTSGSLRTDSGGNVTGGFSDSDLIAAGVDPSAVVSAYIGVFVDCRGFTVNCSNPYSFGFASGPGSLLDARFNLNLTPGSSFGGLLGSFVPNPGPVPDSTYRLYEVGFTVDFVGANGVGLRTVIIGQACTFGNDSCAFTRTVAAPTPAPVAPTLALLGFGTAAFALRRKRS